MLITNMNEKPQADFLSDIKNIVDNVVVTSGIKSD